MFARSVMPTARLTMLTTFTTRAGKHDSPLLSDGA
jgi:hypothetical protein